MQLQISSHVGSRLTGGRLLRMANAHASSSSSSTQQHRGRPGHQLQQAARSATVHYQQPCQRLDHHRNVAAQAAATSSVEIDELVGPTSLQPDVFEIITYALKLAWTSETYYVHSWMVLLGLLKKEDCTACQILQELGLDDLYGAWHEVLWALNVSDGLQPRAFTPFVNWGERASLIVQGSVRFGMWAGRDKVASEDLLMALAASDVLSSLFPDVDLSLDRVKRAIEKRTGVKYDLPGYEDAALSSQDMFL